MKTENFEIGLEFCRICNWANSALWVQTQLSPRQTEMKAILIILVVQVFDKGEQELLQAGPSPPGSLGFSLVGASANRKALANSAAANQSMCDYSWKNEAESERMFKIKSINLLIVDN